MPLDRYSDVYNGPPKTPPPRPEADIIPHGEIEVGEEVKRAGETIGRVKSVAGFDRVERYDEHGRCVFTTVIDANVELDTGDTIEHYNFGRCSGCGVLVAPEYWDGRELIAPLDCHECTE